MEHLRRAFNSVPSAIEPLNWDNPTRQTAEALTDLIKRGKEAADNDEFEGAEKLTRQALVGVTAAMDCYLKEREESYYTPQQLAVWFRMISDTFTSVQRPMDAAICYYRATVFEDNWKLQEHVFVSGMLCLQIMLTKEQEFRENFQLLLNFLQEVERSAILTEHFQRWEVSVQTSRDICMTLETFIRISPIVVKSKRKDTILRESLMRVARCGLEMGNHELVKDSCKKVLEDFGEYTDPKAFEVWGRSLMKIKNDYQTAKKYINSALENAKSPDHIERLQRLLQEIEGKLQKSAEKQDFDPDWLVETEADKHQKKTTGARTHTHETPQKRKHRRPKARERQVQLPHESQQPNEENSPRHEDIEIIYARNSIETETACKSVTKNENQSSPHIVSERKQNRRKNKRSRRRHASNESITSIIHGSEHSDVARFTSDQIDLSDFETDSDDDDDDGASTYKYVSGSCAKTSLEDIDESSDDDTLTFYEQSSRPRGDEEEYLTSKGNSLSREGLQLDESYLDSIKASQRKENNEAFYDEPLLKKECEQLLRLRPNQYKRCCLQIEGCHRAVGTPLKSEDKISTIEISGRSKAGRTFNGDEVVVEILDVGHEQQDKRYGKVVGVLNRERQKDIKHPVFVCTLDDLESHLVRPMCKTVPKIHLLREEILKNHFNQQKNKIELYDYNHGNGTLKGGNIIEINPADRHRYVFLVAYLQWERQQYSIYPLGAIIRILPFGTTVQRGLNILDLQHDVPSVYTAATVKRIESITSGQHDEPPESAESDRTNLTHLDTFTIDPPGSKDLDDALSIEKIEDGFCVGVHIADVTTYVEKDDAIDREARERAFTFYPGMRRPRHMLPEPLSQNICSLMPNKRRRCITVFHYLDTQGNHQRTKILPSVIKSRKQFTYAEVQEIINADTCEEGIQKNIKQLYRLAEKRRRMRLGNSMFALDLETEDYNEDNPEDTIGAHYLVEEFMVLTNWKIAKNLVRTFPDLVPQRCQPPPTQECLDVFMKKEASILNLVLKLQGKTTYPRPSIDRVLETDGDNNVMVPKWVWDMISESPERASRYIKMDELLPRQYLAYQHWLSIQEPALFKCSGSPKGQVDSLHFSLGCAPYTHFTSPIRRYIDIVVHRLVHCMIKGQICTEYTTDEVENVCSHVNVVAKRAKAYEKGCRTLKMARSLKEQPKAIVCFTDDVSDSGVSLCAPDLRFVHEKYRRLPFNLLDMGFKPEEFEDTRGNANVKCKWRKRLYDISGQPAVLSGSARDSLSLVQHPGMMFVRPCDWAEILKCAIEGRHQDMKKIALCARNSLPTTGLDDINTETREIHRMQPCTMFSLSFTRGQALKIQMTAEPQNGMLAPKLQLFDVTKSFKCCLQHTDDPVMHLAYYSTKPTLDQYESVRLYLETWIPLVIMEAAVGSVFSEGTCTINNVPVKFRGYTGKFSLPISYCMLRNIEFAGTVDEDDIDADINKKAFDFICLKCTLTDLTTNTSNQKRLEGQRFWVGHGEITKVVRKRDIEVTSKVSKKNGNTVMEKSPMVSSDGKVIVSFALHKLSPNPPFAQADDNGILRCGVEVLIKSDVDRRTETFLKMLPEVKSVLVRKIALNNEPFDGLDDDHVEIANEMKRDLHIPLSGDVKPLPRNNEGQQKAIDKALRSTFSLIQGPPGTGKTYTGIKLMYLFKEINNEWHKKGNGRKQVLFCGPSNKSVDLVARLMMQRLGELCPKIVRVYGRSMEAVDFPIPGKSFLSKRSTRNAKPDDVLKSVALHHLIRQKGKPYAELINADDNKFKERNYKADPEAVKKYLRTIREASVHELKQNEVILCTTAVASNSKIHDGTDIFQMIIDEAGMCPEPQCLAPIIANEPSQVVLIGDHKQLRPIIMCKEASELGLEKSLFEKYWLSESAREVEKIMLDTQYRMHEQICRFPSKTFYGGMLQTKNGLWCHDDLTDIWPVYMGQTCPHVLIHVEGEEKTLTVSTEEGNDQSKSNDAEIEEVIRVFKALIDRQVPVGSVNVISQYNAQCSELRRRLEREGVSNYRVNTVVSSQGGEWDYVIFSTVRSLPEYKIEGHPTIGWCRQNLGFITDQNQINVALTRARKGLIIIGNKNLLRCNKVWGMQLVRYYEERGCVKSPGEFPRKRTRQEKILANIAKTKERYGDKMFVKGDLPEDVGPYMPSEED